MLSALLRRDRGVVAAALALIAALGWLYLLTAPMPMPGATGVWSPDYLAFSLGMWFLMMVAMMTPTVAPVVLLYDRVMHREEPGWHGRTAKFLTGYFVVWGAFSALATLAQAALIGAGLIDAMGAAVSCRIAAGLLLAVALYQYSPVKAACLEHCQSPLRHIVQRRSGPLRDLRAGAAHGAWCVACCWALMLVLFVGGVMNLAWVAAITLAVTIEKFAPRPDWARRATGACAALAGLWLVLAP